VKYQDVAHGLAGSMHLWRDSAVAILACVVIACLWFYASVEG
jgi:hypothetical protein